MYAMKNKVCTKTNQSKQKTKTKQTVQPKKSQYQKEKLDCRGIIDTPRKLKEGRKKKEKKKQPEVHQTI